MQISIHMVRAVVSAVEQAGGTREALLAGFGDLSELLARSEAWLSVSEYRRMVETALEVGPVLGLHLGERASPVMFQLMAHLVQHASTLGEAIEMIARYSGLLAQGFEPRVVMLPDKRAALRFAFLAGDDATVRAMAELAMAGLMRLLQQYVGQNAYPERVCFAYAAPDHADEYKRVFRGREQFGQRFTELQFPQDWLTRSQLHTNPELYVMLKTHAERQLVVRQRRSTTSDRVEQLLATRDHRALPDMAKTARALGLSSRTLVRKLGSEGVSFADLVAKRRLSAAQRLLELRVLSVREVAEAMGFADAPAFHKAFRRWTGLTPTQYVESASVTR